jgi:hypothetical protein
MALGMTAPALLAPPASTTRRLPALSQARLCVLLGTEHRSWRKVLKEATGEDISTRAMMDYFKPLMSWLEEQNKGRQIGW